MVKKRNKRFNLSNRALYTFITVGIIIILAVGIYAFGAVPNPGHPISQLQTCDSNGQTLIMQNGSWTCGTINGSSGGSNVTSPWLIAGSNIYYNAGNVGINTIGPAFNLDVNGTLNAADSISTSSISTSSINVNGNPLLGLESTAGYGGITYGTVVALNASTGQFSWTDLGNVLSFTTDSNNNNAPSGYYTPSPVVVQLDPNRAVLGIEVSGYTDDAGYCTVGIPGYVAVTGSNYVVLAPSGAPAVFPDIQSSSLNLINSNGAFDTADCGSGCAGPTTSYSDIFSAVTTGINAGNNNNHGGWSYNNAQSLSFIPPGKILVVNAKLWNAVTGPRQIYCDVKILYSTPIPKVTITNNNNDLIYQQHSSTQCTSAGGSVVSGNMDVGFAKMCQFNQATCPLGWTKLYSYTTTKSNTCQGTDYTTAAYNCNLGTTNCNTGSHTWSNTGLENCLYYDLYDAPNNGCLQSGNTCYSTITQVGCY